MGESKAERFLERVVSAARDVFDEVVAVDRQVRGAPASCRPLRRLPAGMPPGRRRSGRLEAGAPLEVRTISEEPHPHEGAIFGVVRALQDARARCFVLAVDYPLLTSEVLEFLRDRGGMPEWNGRPQPLCAVWDLAWLPRIEERIARGELDLRGAAETEIIPESELRSRFAGEPLLNVNTPEEWERAQRFLASR